MITIGGWRKKAAAHFHEHRGLRTLGLTRITATNEDNCISNSNNSLLIRIIMITRTITYNNNGSDNDNEIMGTFRKSRIPLKGPWFRVTHLLDTDLAQVKML